MKQKKNGKINIWKWLFLGLLAAILGCGMVVASRMTTHREDTSKITSSTSEDSKIGTFTTTRDQLNETVATYLQAYQTENFTYKIYASNQQILFEGEYAILGTKLPLYVYFQPSKLEDGSVLLTVTDISVGTLSLPKTEILTYLKNQYKFPDFISVDVDKATVTVQLSQISNSLGIYVKANTIDLYNDQIIFDIYQKSK